MSGPAAPVSAPVAAPDTTGRHEPPTSYGEAAPPLRGILKNPRRGSQAGADADPQDIDMVGDDVPARPSHIHPDATPYRDADGRLHWDESNLASNEWWKENTAPRMKVDEPKTPFVQGTDVPIEIDPIDEDFSLEGSGKPAENTNMDTPAPPPADPNAATEAEVTRLNTEANARLGHNPRPRGTSEEAESRSQAGSDMGRTSRSPSFSLPDGRRASVGRRRSSASSAAVAVGLDAVALHELNGASSSAVSSEYDEQSSEEEAQDLSPEERRKHDIFEAKRKGHYGNESDALKRARELLAQEEEEEA